ncbi:MAG: hypothetical protein R3330_07150, partial [Saprospiraceae bacterium]|nr:hypothetical protein [Saprospiraceae bacterium]
MARICKNDITDHLREHFGANPLRVPEARIRPMCMLEIRKRRRQYLGEFRYLVKGGFEYDLPLKSDPVAPVSDTRSRSIDFKAAFSILSGFLKALGLDPAPVTASITGAKKMAFSFSNVKRNYIDPLQFGKILAEHTVTGNVDNPIL